MENNNNQLFDNKRIRYEWDEENEEWLFSIVDIVGVLTEQTTQRGATLYWGKLKQRMKEEGSQLLTNCQQLQLIAADGKRYKTDVANKEQILRLIQSIPSPEISRAWSGMTTYEKLLARYGELNWWPAKTPYRAHPSRGILQPEGGLP